jgi:hypothetical protein
LRLLLVGRVDFYGTFSRFSVARELWQRGELEKALAEIDRLVGRFEQLTNQFLTRVGSKIMNNFIINKDQVIPTIMTAPYKRAPFD